MAVAPINEVKKVIQYAVSVMPPKKIIMGIPFYCYDCTLPYLPKGEFVKSIGNEEAVKIAIAHKSMIKYDAKAQSPYFNYMDTDRAVHVVWFEDALCVRIVGVEIRKIINFSNKAIKFNSYVCVLNQFITISPR